MADRRWAGAMDGRQESIIPRRKSSGRPDQVLSKAPVTLNKAVLESLFHLPLSEVASRLGICATTIKKVSRRMGIEKWPYKTPKAGRKKSRPSNPDQSAAAQPQAQPAPARDLLPPPARAPSAGDGQDQYYMMYDPAMPARGQQQPAWAEAAQSPHQSFEAPDHFMFSVAHGSMGSGPGGFWPSNFMPPQNTTTYSPYNAAEAGWAQCQAPGHGSMVPARPQVAGQSWQQQAPSARPMPSYSEDRFSCNMKTFGQAVFRDVRDGQANGFRDGRRANGFRDGQQANGFRGDGQANELTESAEAWFGNMGDLRGASGDFSFDLRKPLAKEEDTYGYDFRQFKCSSA